MADMEPFTLVEESKGPHQLFDDVKHYTSGKTADHDYQYLKALRFANPGMIVTSIPRANVNLVAFALAGNATLELDTQTDSFVAWRGFVGPATRGGKGQLGQAIQFAKYRYSWANEQFLLFTVDSMQYVLKERTGPEPTLGPSKATDELIMAAGEWSLSDAEVVWVFDGYWYQDKSLFDEVKKASWDKVILDEHQKKELQSVSKTFFSSKKVYEDLGVPWKRGIMFYGPPGNGKTVSIKALMHTLLTQPRPIPTLYVKAASRTFQISMVFEKARQLAPCLLILEDIETIVNQETRSYFFNELDGLSGNDGLFVVASTNYLDRLDPGLTSRPSRFDRKYLFPEPNEHERTLYCQYWRRKLQDNKDVDFPEKLCPAMARITENFSFAFLQECFVATLLEIANEDQEQGREKDGLDRYKLWRLFKQQADVLRKEIHHDSAATVVAKASAPSTPPSVGPAHGSRSTYTHRGAAYDSTGLQRRSERPTDDAAEKWGLLTDTGETRVASRQAAGPSELPYLTPGGYKLKVWNDTAFEWRPPF